MNRNLFLLVALVVLVVTACGQVGITPAAKKSGTIRVGFPTTPDQADVPSLMAHDLLRAQGYTVETVSFETPELQVAAMASGALDISNGSTRTHWAAVAQGADIVTLMQQAGDEWALVTRAGLETCADLNGKKFGVQSAGSISNALLQAYLKLNCPDIKPEVIFLAGSENRAIALQAGELDGTLVEIFEQRHLEQVAPGQFPTLVNYSSALPGVKVTGVYTTRKFAAAHPETVRDYLRAVLTVYRNIRENPAPLYEAFKKYLNMDATSAKEIADIYLAREIWDVNGGLTQDDVQYSLDFFTEIGSIPPGVDASRLADLTYLDAVIQQIGRK